MTRYTVLTHKDADQFSRLLKRAFPDIRFQRKDYDHYWLFELNPDLTLKTFRDFKPDPADLRVLYVDTMGVRNGDNYRAWIEPAGWEPFWLGPFENGVHRIMNQPELWFDLHLSNARQAVTRADEGALELGIHRIEASYFPDQIEKKRFLEKVWRILAKMTTNKLQRVDPETREPLECQSGSEYCWAGPDAIRWALEHPMRTFGENIRPAGSLDVPDIG